jgi:hypothetical protein
MGNSQRDCLKSLRVPQCEFRISGVLKVKEEVDRCFLEEKMETDNFFLPGKSPDLLLWISGSGPLLLLLLGPNPQREAQESKGGGRSIFPGRKNIDG